MNQITLEWNCFFSLSIEEDAEFFELLGLDFFFFIYTRILSRMEKLITMGEERKLSLGLCLITYVTSYRYGR